MRKIFILLFLLLPVCAFSEDLYIAQTAAGTNDMSSCANAQSMAWLNTAGNWGAGANKVSAGDTVHLCGTITSPLTIQGSGTNSTTNAITIKFETGAKFSKAHWNQSGTNQDSAIYSGGYNYIVIDGGTDGIIESTLNGSSGGTCPGGSCTSQLANNGIYFGSGTIGTTIKNINIRNLYYRTSTTDYAPATTSLNSIVVSGQITNLSIYNVTATYANNLFWIAIAGTSSGVYIYNNTLSATSVAISVGIGSVGATLDDIKMYGNTCNIGVEWYGNDLTYWNPYVHDNCLHLFATQGGSDQITNASYYNNYNGGLTGYVGTSLAFMEGKVMSPLVYNNVFFKESGVNAANGSVYIKGCPGTGIYNNTFVSADNSGTAIGMSPEYTGTERATIKNNIIVNHGYPYGEDSYGYQNSGNAYCTAYLAPWSCCTGSGTGSCVAYRAWILDSDYNLVYLPGDIAPAVLRYKYTSHSGSLTPCETVTGVTSGATGKFFRQVNIAGDDYIELRNVSGTFTDSGEVINGTSASVTTTAGGTYVGPADVKSWGGGATSWTNWLNLTCLDSHSRTGNPDLNSNYTPKVTSTEVIGKGTQLNSIFTTDKNGVIRGSNWDIGAYQYGSGGGSPTTYNLTGSSLSGGQSIH
jgi:hypothetical protein